MSDTMEAAIRDLMIFISGGNLLGNGVPFQKMIDADRFIISVSKLVGVEHRNAATPDGVINI
jgi:hypothetical protein